MQKKQPWRSTLMGKKFNSDIKPDLSVDKKKQKNTV
jgi:hypothetical protein